ncbi:hypothetical protein [Cellulomonas cellasea]|uniref:Glycosyltransferase RgtA/B/C/D-like domain-containing protein n=1 Tax=Cellulomonas cellasea TaxID=43670 RepID=A0A4Y3L3A6_9CELL|nr:hypothetical protein [Cellulomonas cellasea]GEA89955.1 hypothetical protein CCE01nite_39040 [Cellulomonas cellasea]
MSESRAVEPATPLRRPARAGLLVLAAVLAVQVALGVVWWVAELPGVPEYGDTIEYVSQSTTWAVDGYRTIAYPALVRAATEVGAVLRVPWNALLYVAQLAVAAAAAAYLVRTLRPGLDRRWVAALVAVLVTLPLPLHYSASVLTDSLAASALVLLVAALARVAGRADLSWRPVAVAVLGTSVSVMLRPERLYVVLALLGVTVVLVALRVRRGSPLLPGRTALRAVAVLLAAVLVPALGLTVLSRAMQTADLGREPATLTGAVFDRVAYPHLDEARGLLPPHVAAAVPVPAESADRTTVLLALRAVDGDAAVRATVRAALECCLPAVAWDVVHDVAHGLGSPFAVAYDWATGNNGSSQWDFTRMTGRNPGLASAVLTWGVVVACAVAAAWLVLGVRFLRGRRAAPPRPEDAADRTTTAVTIALLLAAALVGAVFFGLVTSLDPNPRYSLATQVALVAIPLVLLVPGSARGPHDVSMPGGPGRRHTRGAAGAP